MSEVNATAVSAPSESVAKLESINRSLRFSSAFFCVGILLFWASTMGPAPWYIMWIGWAIVGGPKIWVAMLGGLGAALKPDYEVITTYGDGRTTSDGGAQSIQMSIVSRFIFAGVMCLVGGFITILHLVVLSIRYAATALSTKAKSSVVPNGFIVMVINVAVFVVGFFVMGLANNAVRGVESAAMNAENGQITTGDFVSRLNASGDGRIIESYTGKSGDVVIPSTLDGLPVVGIDKFVTYHQREKVKVVSVVVPEGVTDIKGLAFEECAPTLTSVKLPQSLERMGDIAFKGCALLTDVTIPPGAKVKYGQYSSGNLPGTHFEKAVPISNMGSKSRREHYFLETATSYDKTSINPFKGCTKLSAASKEAIKASGYKGEF